MVELSFVETAVSTVGGQATFAILSRITGALYDPHKISESDGEEGVKIFTLQTVAVNERLAKFKVRLWATFLRPHRKVSEITSSGITEQGIVLKTFQITIKTNLLGGK